MRIAIDVRELHGKSTGVGRIIRALLAEWRRVPTEQAHEFIQVAPAADAPRGGTVWEQLVLPRVLRQTRADVLFAPAYSGPVFSSVPMVVLMHDVSFAAHPEWFAWREGLRRRITARLAARAAERIITVSEFSKREIVAHLGVAASKIVVVYPGVTAFKHTTDIAGTDLEPTSRTRTVLFVGSIFNRRHVPELIEGFARLAPSQPEMRLQIVGDNRTSPRVNLDAMVASTGMADRIHLRSYVSDDDLPRLYADATAFVYLSEYEGFGLTPLEALASGVPIVLLDTPVAREVYGDAAMYVARPDPALISAALSGVLFDAAERERILKAAPHVLSRYSWTTFSERVLNALVEVGSRRTGSEPRAQSVSRETR
jgi:glycosyltransferase involved in cell wall biosynthesis